MADSVKDTYDIITIVWKFYHKHWEVRSDDEYWEAVCAEADRLYKANQSPLLRGMLHEVIKDMERRYKQNENQNAGL